MTELGQYRYAQTQPMLDLLLAPESFLLSERYAGAVKTLGLAIFFMPVLPLSCVIALAGQASTQTVYQKCSHHWLLLENRV